MTDPRCLAGIHHDVEAASHTEKESVPQGFIRVECSRCGRAKLRRIPTGSDPSGPIMREQNWGSGL